MAQAKFNFPGMTISGKLNDVVYRTRNGKTYVCSLPQVFKKATENQKAIRNDFKFASKLACSLRKAAHAEDAWKKHVRKNQTIYNVIFRNAYNMARGNKISEYAYIYPAFSRSLDDDSVSVENGRIIASLKSDNLSNYYDKSPVYAQMSVVIYCTDPVYDTIPECIFLNHNSKEVRISPNGTFDFDINLNEWSDSGDSLSDYDINNHSSYDNHTYFVSFVLLDKDKSYFNHTETLSFINIK